MNVRVVTINSLQMHACTGHRNRSSDLLKNGKNENSKILLWCGLKGLVLRYSYSKLLIHVFFKLIMNSNKLFSCLNERKVCISCYRTVLMENPLIGASFTIILIYLDS